MVVGIIFRFGNELIEVRSEGNSILFRVNQYGGAFVPIEGIKLSKNGVIKEHPDLKDNKFWKEEAIKRFKEHLKKMKTEKETTDYIIKELTKCGYVPLYMQKKGHRTIKLN